MGFFAVRLRGHQHRSCEYPRGHLQFMRVHGLFDHVINYHQFNDIFGQQHPEPADGSHQAVLDGETLYSSESDPCKSRGPSYSVLALHLP